MREAIEEVIRDLTQRFEICKSNGMYNRASAFEVSIDKLKGVLANDTGDSRNATNDERDHS